MKKKIGFTTSIPVEVLFAADMIPLDINNVFVQSGDPFKAVRAAEANGFPRNYCAWIKGLYTTIRHMELDTVIMVHEGECTNSQKLGEQLNHEGIATYFFSYPMERTGEALKREMAKLMDFCGVEESRVLAIKRDLDRIRYKLHEVDGMTFSDRIVSGSDNFSWLISSSDFCGDYRLFEHKLDTFISRTRSAAAARYDAYVPLGMIGVPPIMNNMFSVIESFKGAIVYNEMPRQFSMVHYADGLYEQYLRFTYPYSVMERIQDIQTQITERSLKGIIHYVQSFCPRQIDDILLRKSCSLPILTIEGDRPGALDERNITRIEAFMERWK